MPPNDFIIGGDDEDDEPDHDLPEETNGWTLDDPLDADHQPIGSIEPPEPGPNVYGDPRDFFGVLRHAGDEFSCHSTPDITPVLSNGTVMLELEAVKWDYKPPNHTSMGPGWAIETAPEFTATAIIVPRSDAEWDTASALTADTGGLTLAFEDADGVAHRCEDWLVTGHHTTPMDTDPQYQCEIDLIRRGIEVTDHD